MNRNLTFLAIAAIFLAIDYYLFQAVRHVMRGLSPTTQRWITIFYWLIPVISVGLALASMYLYPYYMTIKTRNFLASTIFIIYISKIIAIPLLLFDDILRLLRRVINYFLKDVVNEPVSVDEKISRSDFLSKAAVAVAGTHIGLMTWGIISGAHDYRVRRVTLRLKNLPRQFDGLKIGQLSDIHSGSFFNKTAVKGGVELLMKEKPEVVFFTGDLVNNEAGEVKNYIDVFANVKAPLGVFSTLGNHDYGDYMQWDNAQDKIQNLKNLIEAHRLMGWDLLMDEHRPLTVDGESIGILGIQNWGMGGFAKYGNLAKAMQHTEDFPVKLLLSHDPSHWRAQVLNQTDIDVSFAGHTHGMQYGVEIGDFKWSPVQYRYKEWAGLYQEAEQKLYVNRGFGYIGYPGRVGILPEITIFELKQA